MEFFSLLSGIPLSKPAQNGRKGGGEATIPAKPRAEREQPKTCHDGTGQKRPKGTMAHPQSGQAEVTQTHMETIDQDIKNMK